MFGVAKLLIPFISTSIIFIILNSKLSMKPNLPNYKTSRGNGPTTGRKILFIVGQGRVGSTLLGELFNQHDQFIYFFEPLFGVQYRFDHEKLIPRHRHLSVSYRTEVTELLKDLMTCNYRQRNDEYLAMFDMNGFRFRSRKLTSPLFCRGKHCFPVRSTLMNELCANKSLNIAMKILSHRLPDGLQFLESLSMYGQISIINLVRDPRAYLSSMKNVGSFHDKHELTTFKNSCADVSKNIQFGIQCVSRALNIPYAVLRYEDISMQSAVQLGRRISQFLGIDLLNHTVKYVSNKIGSGRKHSKDRYSTEPRDITMIVNKWRKNEKFTFVQNVQSACGEVMKLLGYEFVTNDKMMKNVSKSTLQTFPLENIDFLKLRD